MDFRTIKPKEGVAFKVLEMTGGGTIAHDDRLLLRAQKSDIGLDKDWRHTVDVRHRDGEIEIVNYFDRLEGKCVSLDFISKLETVDHARYRPQCLRGLDLGYGASVDLLNNQMDVYLLDLFNNPGSRYRSALEAMLDLADRGTLRYTPRTDESPRNRREAVRNRIKRYLKPTEYEHDILIFGELGKAVYDDIRASGKNKAAEENTIYLRGRNVEKDTRYSVKIYDVDARDGTGSGERYKIETTLRKAFFKAEGISVADMTFQPDIQERICTELEKGLSYSVGLLSGETMARLAEAVGVETRDRCYMPKEVARAMLRPERTLTARVAELEKDMAEVKRRLNKAGI
jgi:hypothetical protein